jgi:hypothetical protein
MSGRIESSEIVYDAANLPRANSNEIIKSEDMVEVGAMSNDFPQRLENYGFSVTKNIWFDPMLDPKIVNLKKPEKSSFGDVAFTMYVAHPENKTYCVMPLQHAIVRTGFALNTGLYENYGTYGDYPNWYVTLHALQHLEHAGIIVGSSIIRPHDHREITVTLFNFGRDPVELKPMEPVVELLFAGCHTPDIVYCHRTVVACYDGEYYFKLLIFL